ncbi:MAG TPA: 4Fe-4S ferredoxin [Candidatus Latescibacteria bacterium]|nr:4Fe-4S ferredoxin [Candidatus Latescibacterota bacterium]
MEKRLFIDLELCNRCRECHVECSYLYHPHNIGITSLRELAAFFLICRRCEQAPCVTSCPQEALEKQEDGVLKRYNMRCIGCKSCVYACPFGTIYPETVPYTLSRCDYCLGRVNGVGPDCVKSCPEKAVQYTEIDESREENIFLIGDKLAVRSLPWK